MPNRKSGSSDVVDGGGERASLRRFSSLASFQMLNPFGRRRSNNATDNTLASSASELSFSSSQANVLPLPETSASSKTPAYYYETHDEEHVPTKGAHASRNASSSYICLPDEPVERLPRSRTFSNIPLPTRSRKSSAMVPSKSYTRLPTSTLPFSRPTSSSFAARASSTVLENAGNRQPLKNRMKRSDTLPLLPVNLDTSATTGRRTAFKENLSLSPVKTLPPLAMFEESRLQDLESQSYAKQNLHLSTSPGESWPYQNLSKDSNGQYNEKRHPTMIQSSPIIRPVNDKAPISRETKPEPVQRWNSQPVLTNKTNLRSSYGAEIRSHRLLSERQSPTPPLTRTPSSDIPRTVGRLKSNSFSGPRLELSPTRPLVPPKHPVSPIEDSPEPTAPVEPPRLPPGIIQQAEPFAYWCGRFSALMDLYRNEELEVHLGASKAESDKMHDPEANLKRMRRALEHLYSLCHNDQARDSLAGFQKHLVSLHKHSELGRPLGGKGKGSERYGERQFSDASHSTNASSTTLSEMKKLTFLDKLLGRSMRKSLG